mgnify:FL=1
MSEDAIDLKYAKEVADYIGSDHTEVIMTKEQVIDSLEGVIRMLGTFDITTIRASMGMYLLCKWIHENTDIRVLLTGEISDELFGYKYTDFAPSAEEFQKESQKRIRELHMYDVLRADRCISVNSLEARVPFGDLDFVKYVMSVDPAKKMNTYGKGKYLLRHAFEGDYLPTIYSSAKRRRSPTQSATRWWTISRNTPRGSTPKRNSKRSAKNTPTQSRSRKNPCSTARYLKSTIPASPR